MFKSTTQEIEDLIVSLYFQGKTITEISNHLAINRGVVAQVLVVNCPQARTKAKADLINQIKALVDSSASLSANARRLKVHILTIKAAFRDLGIPIPQWNDKNTQLEQQVVTLRQSGLSYRAIGKQLGISYERVRQILQRQPPTDKAI